MGKFLNRLKRMWEMTLAFFYFVWDCTTCTMLPLTHSECKGIWWPQSLPGYVFSTLVAGCCCLGKISWLEGERSEIGRASLIRWHTFRAKQKPGSLVSRRHRTTLISPRSSCQRISPTSSDVCLAVKAPSDAEGLFLETEPDSSHINYLTAALSAARPCQPRRFFSTHSGSLTSQSLSMLPASLKNKLCRQVI